MSDFIPAQQLLWRDTAFDHKQIIDTATTANTTYIATAARGTATSDAKWKVKRIVDDGAGTTTITWSDADQVVTDFAAITYS